MKKIFPSPIRQDIPPDGYRQKGLKIIAISVIGLMLSLITSAVLGITSLFINPSLLKVLFGIVLLVTLILSVIFLVYGGYCYLTDSGNGQEAEKGRRIGINSIWGLIIALIPSDVLGIVSLLIDLTGLKLLFSLTLLITMTSSVLLGIYGSIVYLTESGAEEESEEADAKFIALLKRILPKEFHEEWLGDLQERRSQLLKAGVPPWKVFFTTLEGGCGVIRSYLWFQCKDLLSRSMTTAKRVFRR
jgi:glucan phosphoethanolaminetransferase (alkaline phosphatase superfamily)